MIPGAMSQYKARDFANLTCGVVGCTRRARHQWAYPCAINTMFTDPSVSAWIPLCDECDLKMNDALLAVVGVPDHVRSDLMTAYRHIQADAAFDRMPPKRKKGKSG